MKKVVGQTNLNQVSDWLQIWSDRSILSERSASRAFDEVTPILKQYLPVQGLILEAGCGPADWVYYLRSIGYDVVGMDFCTPILVDSMGQESSLPLVAGDVFQLPFKDDSLEGILSFGVIEHFEGETAKLSEALNGRRRERDHERILDTEQWTPQPRQDRRQSMLVAGALVEVLQLRKD